MRWLLWLYPREWRERYAEEFEELLTTRPQHPKEWLDLLRGALDAHLHSFPCSLKSSDGAPRRQEKRVRVVKATAAAVLIVTVAGGELFGLNWGGGRHAQPAISQRGPSITTGIIGHKPSVTVAVTEQRPTAPENEGETAFTRSGEAITIMPKASTPAFLHVPARIPVYLTIRVAPPPSPSFCPRPCPISTTYIVQSAGHTFLREVHPSHAVLNIMTMPPRRTCVAIFSRRYTFPHPGVYCVAGQLSVGSVQFPASLRLRVTA